MNYTHSFAISAAGMDVERTRVEVATLNLANAHAVQGTAGQRYEPLRVIAHAAAPDAFAGLVDEGMEGAAVARASGPSMHVVPIDAGPRRVHEPGHPMADERGFVDYVNVDPAAEMVSLMRATRAYEANIAAMNTTRMLALRALEIGGPNA